MALLFDSGLLENIYGGNFNGISTLPIDVTVNESHSLNQSITTRAIEGGATVTDGVQILPDSVSMNCIVKSDALGDSWKEKLSKISQLRLARQPFDIVTSLGVYESMFFDGSIIVDRDVTTQNVLVFSATFTKIDIIETASTKVPKNSSGKDSASKRKNAPSVDSGKQQPKEDSSPEKKQSILAGWVS